MELILNWIMIIIGILLIPLFLRNAAKMRDDVENIFEDEIKK